jgi:site-specific DNA-methyltransferase (adenine-specific)
MLTINKLYQGDCLEVMKKIDDKSIDMILCDLPYGTTACKWDVIIPFESLWKQYERIIKDNGAIVLTGSQPFTSLLILSNIKLFKYEWIWDKAKATGHALCNSRPLKSHENILIFYKKQPTYNPQKTKGNPYNGRKNPISTNEWEYGKERKDNNGDRYPRSVFYEKTGDRQGSFHPTAKPVEMFEMFIKTYSNEGELILDNCAGSGTTAIACINTKRNYILIEKEEKYCEIINKRLMEIEKL